MKQTISNQNITCQSCGAFNEENTQNCWFCKNQFQEKQDLSTKYKNLLLAELDDQESSSKHKIDTIDESFFRPPSPNISFKKRRQLFKIRLMSLSALGAILITGSLLLNWYVNKDSNEYLSIMDKIDKKSYEQAIEDFHQFKMNHPSHAYSEGIEAWENSLPFIQPLIQLNDALREPKYKVKLERMNKVLKNYPFLSKQTSISNYKSQLSQQIEAHQKMVVKANQFYQKEYYTQAINLLTPFVASNEQNSPYYLKAKELLFRSYHKKVNYYIVRGHYSKARNIIKEAKKKGIPDSLLKSTLSKIKGLETILIPG